MRVGAELTATLDIPASVLDFWTPRREQTLVEWAAEHVRITEGPAVRGQGASIPWNPDTFPLQRAPLESLEDPKWTRTILLTSPQAWGKTVVVAILLLYALYCRRVSAFYVAGSRELATTQWRKKFEPTMLAHEALATMFFENPDFGGTRDCRLFTNGTALHMAGAESIGALSGFTAPVGVFDDLQAYVEQLVRFGHAADYGVSRTESYPPDQISLLFAGTASTIGAWLWRSMLGSAFFCPFVPCLECGTYQLIEFDRFEFDREDPVAARGECYMRCANGETRADKGTEASEKAGGDRSRLEGERRDSEVANRGQDDRGDMGDKSLAKEKGTRRGKHLSAVSSCSHRITFDDLPEMLDKHVWASMPPGVDWILSPPAGGATIDLNTADLYPDTKRNTSAAGFWSNAYVWPLGKSWGDRAAEWIGISGDPDRLKTHQQNEEVKPFEEPSADEDMPTPDDVKAHAFEGHHWKTIPEEAGVHDGKGVVLISADIQAAHIWYEVCAWRLEDGRSWLIECGRYGKEIHFEVGTSKRQRMKVWKPLVLRALEKLWAKDNEGWPVVGPGGEVIGQASGERVLVDCSFLRELVQNFCRVRNAGRWLGKWMPLEGSQSSALGKVKIRPHEMRLEVKSKRRYWESNTNRAKLLVRELLAVPPGQAASFALPDDMPDQPREWLAKHFCGEEWQPDIKRWKKVGPNHLLDCHAEQICGALCCDVQLPGFEVRKRIMEAGYPERGSGGDSGSWKIGR